MPIIPLTAVGDVHHSAYEDINFLCPNCGETSIEEVESAMVYSLISGWYNGYPEYCDSDTEHLETVRFQCWGCGMVILDRWQNQGEIQRIIKEKGWYEGAPAVVPQSDWEL